MPAPISLHLPQPCAESWDAMTPTSTGRHCAACQKTVVDFTQKTDAEVLAYFRQATGRNVCGRLRHDQLNRPLLPGPVGASAASRWRTWLALVLAAGSAERVEAAAIPTPHPVYHRQFQATAKRRRPLAARYVQGTVRDSATGAPLVGVAVFLRGESRQTTTDANGWFGLRLSARRPQGGRALVLHYRGYQSETQRLPGSRRSVTRLVLALRPDAVAAAGAQVEGQLVVRRESYATSGAVATIRMTEEMVRQRKPWPWHPRSFYRWLSRPFHRTP